MKNRRAQMKSLKNALKNYKPLEKDDKKDEVQEDAPANSISVGGPVAGHDNIPLGHEMMRRIKEVPVTDRRYKLNSSKANTLKKKYRGKELLLTTFKKHAYGK